MRGTGFYWDSLVVPLKGLNFGITVDFFGKLVLILPKLFDRIYQWTHLNGNRHFFGKMFNNSFLKYKGIYLDFGYFQSIFIEINLL